MIQGGSRLIHIKGCLSLLKQPKHPKFKSRRPRALSLTDCCSAQRRATRTYSVTTSRANRTGEENKRTYFLPRFCNLKGASLDSRPQSSQREYRLCGLKENRSRVSLSKRMAFRAMDDAMRRVEGRVGASFEFLFFVPMYFLLFSEPTAPGSSVGRHRIHSRVRALAR